MSLKMESTPLLRKCLPSSTLLSRVQRSEAVQWRARPGSIEASKLEKEVLTSKKQGDRSQYSSADNHSKASVYHSAHFNGDTQNKMQYCSNDARSQTSSMAVPPSFPPSQPQIGSPLMWIGVGVGISIVFSWAARKVQGYAMQQALKSMMQQTGQGGNTFAAGPGSNPFAGPGSGLFAGMGPGTFPIPPRMPTSPAPSTTVDVTPQAVSSPQSEAQVVMDKPIESRKTAFTDVDVSLLEKEEPQVQAHFRQQTSQKPSFAEAEVVEDAASFSGANAAGSEASSAGNGSKGKSFISIEMLETMLDDPKIQQMVFPYLPAEMRDPATFKQMIQLPQVRQQLQEALNNMGGEDGLDMLKYMNNDVVKQQFEQIGLTPEEVVGKILASPDIAASLQNPKVVEAIMDCSQNPLNITKYQNDAEVMNALMKIAELFPNAAGSPF